MYSKSIADLIKVSTNTSFNLCSIYERFLSAFFWFECYWQKYFSNFSVSSFLARSIGKYPAKFLARTSQPASTRSDTNSSNSKKAARWRIPPKNMCLVIIVLILKWAVGFFDLNGWFYPCPIISSCLTMVAHMGTSS